MKNSDIMLYALSTCIHCRDAKSFLDKCGVDYNCIDVDKLEGEQRREIIDEIKKSNPGCAFPMLIIGDRVIIGFRSDEIKEALALE
jgi:glutaredoxin-like protein NrdH